MSDKGCDTNEKLSAHDETHGEDYIRTDEQLDVVDSLQEVLVQVNRVEGDPHCWKWAIIAMTCAVNSAMICHLSGTMAIGALEKDIAKKTLAAFDAKHLEDLPKPKVASPKDLLKRLTSEENRFERAGQKFNIPRDIRLSFEQIFDMRNNFVHFSPKGWSIQISGLPKTFLDLLWLIDTICCDQTWALRHLDDMNFEKLSETRAGLRDKLNALQIALADK